MFLERIPSKIAAVFAISKIPALIFCLAIPAFTLLGGNSIPSGEKPDDLGPAPVVFTNILQVRHLVVPGQETARCLVRLEGIVLWVSPAKDRLILQDATGGIVVNTDLRNQPSVQPGEKLRIKGNCLSGRGGIVSEALIDNDGIHASFQKSMTLPLSAGLHPVSAEWFNGPLDFELKVDWMGPGTPRQRIPDTALFRTEPSPAGETNRLVPGLNCRCYEGEWEWLPDFSQLPVLKSGAVTNFNLQLRTRNTNVGLEFSGYLKVPKAGIYTIWTTSDDGSRLSLDDLVLQFNVLGPATLPMPRRLVPDQIIPEEQECLWSEVEGVVVSVGEEHGSARVEVTAGTGRVYLKFAEGSYDSLKLMMHNRIRVAGACQNTYTLDGQAVPALLVPDLKDAFIKEIDPTYWADYPVQSINSLGGTNLPATPKAIIHVGGTVCSNSPENSLLIEDESGRIVFETAQAPPRPGDQIEALGWWSRVDGRVVLRDGVYQKVSRKKKADLTKLPLITKAVHVIGLSRTEARRGYPVKIRGVITAQVGHNFFIQDSTWSVYAACNASVAGETPRVGDYWEIEGKSDVEFAPEIQVSRTVYLGPGTLPEPIHPTWDELVNGSLATKYVEIQGIATAVEANDIILLTHEGKIKVELEHAEPTARKRLEGALIRVRGVGSPYRDTNQMMQTPLRFLRLYNPSVSIDEPAPSQPFETPLKQVADLLHFDVRADALQRIRIAGQVLSERGGEYFLTDGVHGLRFEPASPTALHEGDLVEVVGFPDLGGPSPVLREALVRLTGRAHLPTAERLSEKAVLSGMLDATLVTTEARLTGITVNHTEQTLELQTGTRNYAARLANSRGRLPDIAPGSLLELTGVYAGEGGDRTLSRGVDSFELLLNTPADVRVLAHPSWWTFRHTMAVLCGMMLVILLALVWIVLLRREVEERSRQLTSEIKSREQAERQRALEAERARIAQDLHDDLGATLTEIRFLSAVKSCDALLPEATRSQLMEVSEKSRQMVSSLDEIVWAVNPANDLLPSTVNYFCHVTEEFLRTAKIRCRLDVDESLPSVALTSEVRHNLCLAVREALTNVAKHSQAAEAWLRIHWQDQTLQIVVQDNGCGFVIPGIVSMGNGNGLSNMRARLEKIGGHFECDTRPGSGTICRINLPFK